MYSDLNKKRVVGVDCTRAQNTEICTQGFDMECKNKERPSRGAETPENEELEQNGPTMNPDFPPCINMTEIIRTKVVFTALTRRWKMPRATPFRRPSRTFCLEAWGMTPSGHVRGCDRKKERKSGT